MPQSGAVSNLTFYTIYTYKWSAKVDFVFKYTQLNGKKAVLRRRSQARTRRTPRHSLWIAASAGVGLRLFCCSYSLSLHSGLVFLSGCPSG